MKKLSNLPRWLILAIAVFLCLVFAKVVFPVEIPREIIQCVKHLVKNDHKSFVKFCADTVIFGQAFSDNCVEMTKRGLVRFLGKHDLSRENRGLFQRFPKGFEINWDRKKGELVCCHFRHPPACLIYEQKEKLWRLTVLGIYFPETERKDK